VVLDKSYLSEGDFFFMGLSQRRVFPHNLMTAKQLKECMQQEVRAIPQEMLQKVRENLQADVNNALRKMEST